MSAPGSQIPREPDLAELMALIEELHQQIDLLVRLCSTEGATVEEMGRMILHIARVALARPERLGHGAAKEPAPPFKRIGDVVRHLRELAGITRQELQAQTGVNASTIRNIEMGRHVPTRATIRKLLQHPAMASLPRLARAAGLKWRRRKCHLQPCAGKGPSHE